MRQYNLVLMLFFNPRLREGGDLELNCITTVKNFQSTPPRRRRLLTRIYNMRTTIFSIHASAKEATRQVNNINRGCFFQSTPPRRRRRSSVCVVIHAPCFQSTPPRRRRRLSHRREKDCKRFFNPRLREGGDIFLSFYLMILLIFSIHASAKEATTIWMV